VTTDFGLWIIGISFEEVESTGHSLMLHKFSYIKLNIPPIGAKLVQGIFAEEGFK